MLNSGCVLTAATNNGGLVEPEAERIALHLLRCKVSPRTRSLLASPQPSSVPPGSTCYDCAVHHSEADA